MDGYPLPPSTLHRGCQVGAAPFKASWEGEATMSLLSRSFQRALPVLIPVAVIMLLALPATRSDRASWSAIGPTCAWAGSPDETLNPPPNPPSSSTPKKGGKLATQSDGTSDLSATANHRTTAPSDAVSARDILYVLWRIYLATAVRF